MYGKGWSPGLFWEWPLKLPVAELSFRSACTWSSVSGLDLSQWLRSSRHNVMIHCNAHDFTQAGPWQPGLKGGVSVGSSIAQRECLSHETWHTQDSLGRNYLPPGLCIWVWVCSSLADECQERIFFLSRWPGYRHMVFVVHSLRIHKVETGGWQVFGASQDCMVKLLLLKKGQVSERFKQAEETPTKLSVPHPQSVLFCFLCRMAGKPVKLPHWTKYQASSASGNAAPSCSFYIYHRHMAKTHLVYSFMPNGLSSLLVWLGFVRSCRSMNPWFSSFAAISLKCLP